MLKVLTKRRDRNLNVLCADTEQKKRYRLRKQQDTEALEEIKEYEDTASDELREVSLGNSKRRTTDW